MKRTLLAMAVLAALVTASPASADNVRPIPVFGTGLQSQLDTIFGTGVVNAATDQHATGMWSVSSFPPVVTPTLVFEGGSFAPSNIFSIWSGAGASTLVPIFFGPASAFPSASSVATLVWFSPTTVTIFGGPGQCGITINCGTFSGINSLSFGFALTDPFGQTFYTVDSLNPDGIAHALAYRGPSSASDTWAIGFEDLFGGGDLDYEDMVVKIESIKSAPEPGTLMLLGTAMLGLAAVRRKLS